MVRIVYAAMGTYLFPFVNLMAQQVTMSPPFEDIESRKLPAQIQDLIKSLNASIQMEKQPPDIRGKIAKYLGEPDSYRGSGVLTPIWHVGSGAVALTVRGPLFEADNGAVTWLVDSSSKVGETLYAHYEFLTRPTRTSAETYVGTAKIEKNGSYSFLLEEAMPKAGDTFFRAHPVGITKIILSKDLSLETRLGSVRHGAEIGNILFVADGNSRSIKFRILNDQENRRIILESDDETEGRLVVFWRVDL